MFYAVDKATGETFDAEHAVTRRYGVRRYLCPCCGKPVVLRAGARYSPYFAHRAHVALPDCENYYPGGQYVGGSHASYVAPPRPLSLYLTLDNPSRSRSTWSIELLVPKNPDARGVLSVPAGVSGTIPINCARLKDSGQRIPVRLLTDNYKVLPSEDVEAEYRRKLSVITPGFDTTIANVFRYADNGGRRLEAGKPLYWGRGYFLVWPASLTTRWPKHLWREEVGCNGAWNSARIELPPELDDDIASWAATLLNRDIERPPVSLTLVAPASAIRLEDESILIPQGTDVLVGIVSEYGSTVPEELHVTTAATGESRSVLLTDPSSRVLSLGRLPAGTTTVDIDEEAEVELTLNIGPRSESLHIVGPRLHFGAGERAIELPSHSTAAELALREARLGGEDLRALSLPFRAGVQLRTRSSRRAEWKVKNFAWDPNEYAADAACTREFEQSVLAAVLSALTSSSELDLDFGNFGSLVVPADVVVGHELHELKLPASLRGRLHWASILPEREDRGLLQVPVPELARAAQQLLSPPWHVSNANDRVVLLNLSRPRSWIAKAIPQLRELATDLHNLTRRGS